MYLLENFYVKIDMYRNFSVSIIKKLVSFELHILAEYLYSISIILFTVHIYFFVDIFEIVKIIFLKKNIYAVTNQNLNIYIYIYIIYFYLWIRVQ